MTKKERWIVDDDDELRLFYGDENFNGSAYPCDDIVFMEMIANELNNYERENKQLIDDAEEYRKLSIKFDNRNKELIAENALLEKENQELKQQLDDIKTYDKEHFAEAEHINDIYKEEGFCGVIEYAKDKLQNYGVVKEVEKGLWVMVTGGWSDNEFWLDCLNNPVSMFGMKHYRGYLRGGAFYYTEKPRGDVEIRLKGDVE